jgi:hypothetical protein
MKNHLNKYVTNMNLITHWIKIKIQKIVFSAKTITI